MLVISHYHNESGKHPYNTSAASDLGEIETCNVTGQLSLLPEILHVRQLRMSMSDSVGFTRKRGGSGGDFVVPPAATQKPTSIVSVYLGHNRNLAIVGGDWSPTLYF
ncbi:hypothetical protein M8C21_026346, partial [Ambrosia artemisiifolia]